MSKAITTGWIAESSAHRVVLLLLALLLGGLYSGASLAQKRDCTLTVNAMNFGNYDPLETTVAAVTTSTMTLRCNRNNTRVRVTLSTGSSGTFANRTMRQGASTLSYNIFSDANFVRIWGDNTGGSRRVSVTVKRNQNVTLTLYGRIPPGQDPSIGLHSDTIIVTITF